MKNNCKIFKFGLILFIVLIATQSFAQIIEAESCSQEDVQAAVDAASVGDTVKLPAESATWNQTIVINKGIILQGSGVDKTIITDATGEAYNEPMLYINCNEDDSFRVTGLTFTNINNRAVDIDGTSKTWRVDHCKFDNPPEDMGGDRYVFNTAETYTFGVIDHCEFINGLVNIQSDDDNGSWERPLTLGTNNAVYIEDCTFYYGQEHGQHEDFTDAEAGARLVVRFNTITNAHFHVHGNDGGSEKSTHSYEFYENIFLSAGGINNYKFGVLRGGTGVVFNNTSQDHYGPIQLYHSLVFRTHHEKPKCTVYPCIDQVGRTTDHDNDGIQDLVPIYEWNNINNGEDLDIQVNMIVPEMNEFIQEGREFINDTPKPGYVPYTYPHPLTVNQSGRLLSLQVQSQNPITLQWDIVNNAVHYLIVRDWVDITTITANTYEDDSTGNSYIVKAVNSEGKIIAMEGINLSGSISPTPDDTINSFQIQNIYPNPLKTLSTISFNIKEAGEYQINIINILGQEVKHLFKGEYTEGQHEITWDGTNNTRTKVRQGVYFVKISSGEHFVVGRIVVLK